MKLYLQTIGNSLGKQAPKFICELLRSRPVGEKKGARSDDNLPKALSLYQPLERMFTQMKTAIEQPTHCSLQPPSRILLIGNASPGEG